MTRKYSSISVETTLASGINTTQTTMTVPNSSAATSLLGGQTLAAGNPRTQSEGKFSVDFLQNTYQNEVANRTPGDKVVTQATADNATVGEFNTAALGYYSTLVNSPLKAYKSRVIHKYNSATNKTFLDSTQIKNTPGALYISPEVSAAE